LIGNNVVTVPKYSISGNTWANISPTVARGGNAVAGMTADFVGKTGNATWALTTNIQDGRYIYSFRGTTSVLDRLSLNGGTSGAYTWETVTYQPSLVVYATGTSSARDEGTPCIYIAKEGSTTVPQRIYRFCTVTASMSPIAADWYLAGAGTLGNKLWVRALSSAKAVKWLYLVQATAQGLRRIMYY
jgi:hypothetical protein